ncbi:MAG: GNAT family N-acetyltransferase [Candidatus Thorarchaeota archaeon]
MRSFPAGSAEIKEIEMVAYRAWPAREVVSLGGWLLRADLGVTRRANSVLPIGEPSLSLDEAIDHVIDFYHSRDLVPRFQMTKASCPIGLDEVLDNVGFCYNLKTYVETASLGKLTKEVAAHDVELYNHPTREWLSAFAHAGEIDEESAQVRGAILERIQADTRFALIRQNGRIAGVCVGVLEGQWLGLFGLVTEKEHRHKGIAISLNQELASWASKSGATMAYLQVVAENEAALSLYHRLGFRIRYVYWYRQLAEKK